MWKDFFSFNRAERRGIWVLAALTISVWVLNSFLPLYFGTAHEYSGTELDKLRDAVDRIKAVSIDEPRWKSYSRDSSYRREPWKYDDYNAARKRKAPREAGSAAESQTTVDLNLADSAALDELPGIGKVLSSRIVRYRDRLGGFHSIDQLHEVYGLPADWTERNAGRFSINPSAIHLLDIGSADFRTLARHPYIGYELTRTIMNLRRKDQLPEDELSLCHRLGLSDSLTARLLPYIRL